MDRRRSSLPFLAAAAALAAGAGLGSAGCSRAAGCPVGKTCIRYMAWGNPEQLDTERRLIAEFERRNPDLRVKLFTVPASSYGSKMTTMLVSRTAPDVLRVDHYGFPSLQRRGYFQDLTDLADADPTFDRADFYRTAIDEGTVNGRLYGLNALYGGVLIYYNKTLHQRAGLEDPWELYRRGEWTWARYREHAIALTRFENGRPRTFGVQVPPWPASVPVIWAFGGEVMDERWERSRIASPGTVAAYQFLADLVWKDRAAPTPSQNANAAFTFESGKVGMVVDWMGMSPRYRSVVRNFEWDVVPLPRGPRGWHTLVKGNQLVIAANSRHRNEAWRFLRYMSDADTERYLHGQLRRAFPTRPEVAESDAFLRTELPPFNTRAFVDTVRNARRLPITDRWPEWTQILNAELDDLMSGRERDAATVLRRAEAKINRALAEEPGF